MFSMFNFTKHSKTKLTWVPDHIERTEENIEHDRMSCSDNTTTGGNSGRIVLPITTFIQSLPLY